METIKDILKRAAVSGNKEFRRVFMDKIKELEANETACKKDRTNGNRKGAHAEQSAKVRHL